MLVVAVVVGVKWLFFQGSDMTGAQPMSKRTGYTTWACAMVQSHESQVSISLTHLAVGALVQAVGHLVEALVDDAQRLAHLLQPHLRGGKRGCKDWYTEV